MRLPFVSRERYDEKCVALAALQEKYERLLAERAAAQPVQPARAVKPAKAPQNPMVDKLAADLRNVIQDDGAARAEAERIRREAFGGVL